MKLFFPEGMAIACMTQSYLVVTGGAELQPIVRRSALISFPIVSFVDACCAECRLVSLGLFAFFQPFSLLNNKLW